MLAISPATATRPSLYDMDESGTINPAALNASSSSSTIAPTLLSQQMSRGVKRGRSTEADDALSYSGINSYNDNSKSSKRSKSYGGADDPTQQMLVPVQTPQVKPESLPQASPTHTSPQRTPGSASKTPVVKALPTVRDHTTDQLNDEKDEYIYREVDPDGENKATKDGYPLDNRRYKCRTFQVPKRGEKLFMLATECARVLGYRDSYLLFNKNRSLYKIIANQEEKDDLIRQEILPYSYRSRQIAIVTARSMFRQFGSRLIEGGRRVRDDYWEAKARKQGFTEEDAAGEKRPGAARAREAAAAAEANNTTALNVIPHTEIIYSTNGLDGPQPPNLLQQQSLAPLPMIHLPGDELRPGGYGTIARPRQEVTGAPYQDRSQPSTSSEIIGQANTAADWNKQLGVTRQYRTNYLNEYWRRPHEQPVQPSTQPDAAINTVTSRNLTSPQSISTGNQPRLPTDQVSHAGNQMMSAVYPAYQNQQNPMASPVQSMHRSLPPNQMHQNSPGMPGSARGQQTPQAYAGYQQNQMWQQQAQQSPMQPTHNMQGYGQQQSQHSPMPPPQLGNQANMSAYGQMAAMNNPAMAALNRGMYQPSPSPQQYGMPQQSPGQQQNNNMQGWPNQGNMSQYPQGY